MRSLTSNVFVAKVTQMQNPPGAQLEPYDGPGSNMPAAQNKRDTATAKFFAVRFLKVL